MTFIRLAYFPGGTEAQYQALAAAIGDVPAPPGRVMFAAGPVEGGWQVVQVWDSREQLDAFNRSVLAPATASIGAAGFPKAPAVTDFEPADFHL